MEKKGIPTVSVTVARDVTEKAKPPRAVFVPFMMGHQFGVPGHRDLQLRIIKEALELVVSASESGEICDLPITWAQARMEAKHLSG